MHINERISRRFAHNIEQNLWIHITPLCACWNLFRKSVKSTFAFEWLFFLLLRAVYANIVKYVCHQLWTCICIIHDLWKTFSEAKRKRKCRLLLKSARSALFIRTVWEVHFNVAPDTRHLKHHFHILTEINCSAVIFLQIWRLHCWWWKVKTLGNTDLTRFELTR